MNEIKFRAWHKHRHYMGWVKQIIWWRDAPPMITFYPYDSRIEGTEGLIGISHVELMQYTGFLDKHGKEIWQSDRVLIGEVQPAMPPYDTTEPRIVELRNGCWCFDANRYDNGDWIRFGFWTHSNDDTNQLKQIEVVGNIYEN